MAKFSRVASIIEAIQIPDILIDEAPADLSKWSEQTEWLKDLLERGDIRPTFTEEGDTFWVYEVGNVNTPDYAFPGNWVVEISKNELRVATNDQFTAIYHPAFEVNEIEGIQQGHNVLASRYDEMTLTKVYQAFIKNGVDETKAMDVINDMQNDGILFRERA